MDTPQKTAELGAVAVKKFDNGFYDGIPNDVYHGGPGISKSGLDQMEISPRHYWDKYLNPDRPQEEYSEALFVGSALHALVLEPHVFESEYTRVPADAPKRPTPQQINAKNPSPETVACVEWWAKFNAASQGKKILTDDKWDHLHKLRDALLDHPAARHLIELEGHTERVVYYNDPDFGVLRKAKLDKWIDLPDGRVLVVDLKTCQSAKPEEFVRHSWDYRYHVQAAWGIDLIRDACQREVAGFVFINVEKTRPYPVSVMPADDETIAEGRKAYRQNLDRYALCMKNGQWPAYGDGMCMLGVPGWVHEANRKKWR